VAIVLLVVAFITIFEFARTPHRMNARTAAVIVFWGLVPPIWFFAEYYAVDHDWLTSLPGPKAEMLESIKTYADYASKIWAAVLAAILFLVKKEPAPGFNFNVEEWDANGQTYETLAICRTLALARTAFAAAIAEKPAGRFIIRSRSQVVQRHPEGDW
jgi:hypothetical protein